MDCEVCGKRIASTTALIEGARLNVCASCAGLGQELVAKKVFVPSASGYYSPSSAKQLELEVVENYNQLVSSGRQKTGLSAEQLAQKLSINADYLRQIEGGRRKPDERTARKLEAALKIKLFEQA